MMPFVSMIVAPSAFGIAAHATSVSTHVIVSSSTSTAPSRIVSGVTIVPSSKMWFGAPGMMVTPSGLGASAVVSRASPDASRTPGGPSPRAGCVGDRHAGPSATAATTSHHDRARSRPMQRR